MKTEMNILISLLIVALFFLALPYDSEYYELYFFTKQYVEIYSNIILELFKIIMPIGIIIITFEHDASFIRVLSTKLGRDKIISFKQLNYNLIVIITYLMLNALYLLILSLTGY